MVFRSTVAAVLACSLALLGPVPAFAQDIAKLQRVIDEHFDARAPVERFTALSASISPTKGKANLNLVAGRVSRAPEARPVTPSSLFQIGSITKSMTAAVMLQLAAEGRLSLDDPLSRWLPEYPAWRDVTIRRLLNMTSSIPGYDKAPGVFESMVRWGLDRQFSGAVLVGFIDPERPGAPPPTKGYDYSNTNYILAGMIVERATGEPFADELTRRIVRGPAGLRDTFYSAGVYPEPVLDRLTSVYFEAVDDPEAKAILPLRGIDLRRADMSWAGAAGGALATPEDVTRWVRALFQGPVLHDKERSELKSLVSMKSGQPIAALSADDPQGFGLGVVQAWLPGGKTVWTYEGGTLGHRFLYVYFPSDDLVIAVAANSGVGEKPDKLSDLVRKLYEAATGKPLSIPPPSDPSATRRNP